MIRVVKQYNILFIIGCFILLYNPPILPINGMHVVGVISIIYLMINNRITKHIISFERCRNAFLFMMIWFIYLIFIVLANSTSFEACANPLYFIIDILPFATAIQIYNQKHGLKIKDVINLMLLVGTIQAIFAVAAFFNSNIQEYFINKLLSYGYGEILSVLAGWRAYGFSGSLTFGMPVIQSVLSIIALFYASKQKKSFGYILISVLLLFSAVINARTSLIVVIIGLFVLLMLSGLSVKKKVLYLIISVVLIVAFQFCFLPWLEEFSFETYKWIMEGIEDINRFIHNDSSGSYYFSYATSADKYKLPEGIISVLFGVGHYTMGMKTKYGYSTDIGYINDWWLGGILYIIFIYVYFYKAMFFMKKNNDPIISSTGLFLMICYVLLNIKGIMFSMMPLTNFMVILYFVSAAEMESMKINYRSS